MSPTPPRTPLVHPVRRRLSGLAAIAVLVAAVSAHAGDSEAPPQHPETPVSAAPSAAVLPDFAPPPVPDFMLRKPERPLTLEEMARQADEAAERARRERRESPPR